ncbi:MAG: ATP-dependent Clp protease ATP-binding subunit [Acidobacteria bacterium]|nr:ATP-dependent Clp protease ATP-binding subunit [Acidobacteriota bacterium]
MSEIEAITALIAPEARSLVEAARHEAQARACFYVGVEHLFVALVKRERSKLARALETTGVDPKSLRDAVRRFAGVGSPEIPFAPPAATTVRLRAIVRDAAYRARSRGGELAGEGDLIEAILGDDDASPSIVLRGAGVDIPALELALASSAEAVTVPGRMRLGSKELEPGSILARFGRDLTALAAKGELATAVGRDSEIRELLRALCRQTKNAPLLIGEPGVGKTAIVEELANRIAHGDVPDAIAGKHVVEISLASIVAGTKYRGEFEERMEKLIREARDNPDILLFVDEIHSLVGAGAAEGSPMDAGDVLKPSLARGEIRVIGATTPRDYAQSIEKDGALARRFQTIRVDEPSPAASRAIVLGRCASLEAHHGVTIMPDAIDAAVTLSVRYIPDRKLPDKAIDLVDEACVRLRVRSFAGKFTTLVTADLVAEALSAKTGIPLQRLTESEQKRLLRMEDALQARVVGQDEACRSVAERIRLARAGLRDPRKPVGVLFFLGPSGVGKTELARAVAEFLDGSDDAMIRVDMSEYQEKHTISRLIGSPPGYVGSDEEGQLTQKLRHRPASVVLLDEIEKAHPDIWDLFLQVFDDGRLTDAQGRVADCRHAIFIMTSNACSDLWNHDRGIVGFGTPREDEAAVLEMPAPSEVNDRLAKTFRPEFLNRVDELVLFRPLGAEELAAIARIQIERLLGRVRDQGIVIHVTEAAIAEVARRGWDPAHGARPIERSVEDNVARPLSAAILNGRTGPGGRILIDAKDGEIAVDASGGDVRG